MNFPNRQLPVLICLGILLWQQPLLAVEYFAEKLFNQHFGSQLTAMYITNDGSTIFLGTDHGFIYISNDNGETWHETHLGTSSVAQYDDFSVFFEIELPNDGRKDHTPKVHLPLIKISTNNIHYQPDIGKVKAKDFSAYEYSIQKRHVSSADPGNVLSYYLYDNLPSIVITGFAEADGQLLAQTNMGLFTSTGGNFWYPAAPDTAFKPEKNPARVSISGTNFTLTPYGLQKESSQGFFIMPLPPQTDRPITLYSSKKNQKLWLLTATQLFCLENGIPPQTPTLPPVLGHDLRIRLQSEPNLGQAINYSFDHYGLTNSDLTAKRKKMRLSHWLPKLNFDANISNKYQTWRITGLGKLGKIPHNAPIVTMRKHALGSKYFWNPTKFLAQLNTDATDDRFGFDLTLVATWDFWGLAYDSREAGKTWQRLYRARDKMEIDVRQAYHERYHLMTELLYQPGSIDKQLLIITRLEELTTLLNEYTNNRFTPFNALEFMEVLDEH